MSDDNSDYVLLAAIDDLSEQAQAIPSEWVAIAWEAGKRPNGLYSVRHALAAVAPLIEQRVIERLQKLAPSFQKVGDTSEWADGYRAGARDALDAAAMVIKDMNEGDRP